MFDMRTTILDVPLAAATVLQLRYTNAYNRTLTFRNLTASTLSVTVQEYISGAWTTIGTAFDVGVKGGGTDIVTKLITSANQLRIQASGGADDRDMLFAVHEYVDDSGTTSWSSAIV